MVDNKNSVMVEILKIKTNIYTHNLMNITELFWCNTLSEQKVYTNKKYQ